MADQFFHTPKTTTRKNGFLCLHGFSLYQQQEAENGFGRMPSERGRSVKAVQPTRRIQNDTDEERERYVREFRGSVDQRWRNDCLHAP
jgi:hypothetical protein